MDPSKQELVTQFCGFTGAIPEQASFFLESSAWDLSAAVSCYFDNHGETEETPQPASADHHVQSDDGDEEDSAMAGFQREQVQTTTDGFGNAGPSSKRKENVKAGIRQPRGNDRIKTFADLGRNDDDSKDDDDDGPQEYYTGGEKSGMMVQDPTYRNRPTVDSIFDQARQQAIEGSSADLDSEQEERQQQDVFVGQGRTVGRAPGAEEAVSSTPPVTHTEVQPHLQGSTSKPPTYRITFWANGFTVDDGPLRQFNDPANAAFLNSLNRGDCPRELAPSDPLQTVDVSLVRRRDEYTPPEQPSYQAFAGSGQRLGGSASEIQPPLPATGSSPSLPRSTPGLTIDESKPVTSLQLRLSDGTRMVARFNHDHTVAHIRSFIDMSRPGSGTSYVLQTIGFPPRQLTDVSQTIEQADLISSVIVQR